MKQEKRDILERMSLYDFEGTFEEAIENLQKRAKYYRTCKKVSSVYSSFVLDVISKEYEDGNEIGIIGIRLETDEEQVI